MMIRLSAASGRLLDALAAAAALLLLAIEFVFRFQRLVTGERTHRLEATSVS